MWCVWGATVVRVVLVAKVFVAQACLQTCEEPVWLVASHLGRKKRTHQFVVGVHLSLLDNDEIHVL